MKGGDVVFFRLNLVMLLFVSLLPFSTRLMVTHVEAADAAVAVAMYGANLFVASGLITALLYYVERHRRLVVDDVADDRVRQPSANDGCTWSRLPWQSRGPRCSGCCRRHLHCPDRRVSHPAADWGAAKTLTLIHTTIYQQKKGIRMIAISTALVRQTQQYSTAASPDAPLPGVLRFITPLPHLPHFLDLPELHQRRSALADPQGTSKSAEHMVRRVFAGESEHATIRLVCLNKLHPYCSLS